MTTDGIFTLLSVLMLCSILFRISILHNVLMSSLSCGCDTMYYSVFIPMLSAVKLVHDPFECYVNW